MSPRFRMAFIWLLSAALVVMFSPMPGALAHGGGGGGGGGGGHGGGGYSGGHVGGSGFSAGHYSGSGWGASHVGTWAAPSHVSNWSGAHTGNGAGHTVYAHPQSFHSTPYVASLNRGHVDSFVGRPGTWNHGLAVNHGVWNHGVWNHGVWNHDRAWWGHHEPDRDDFFRFGLFGWPWYGLGWRGGYGYGNWWPGYYDYGYGPYYGDLYGSYYDTGTVPYVASSDVVPSEDATPVASPIEENQPEGSEVDNQTSQTSDFFSEALTAFREGDYGNATRLAGHAAIDDPRNPDVHTLAMLGLFAMGEYRGAAIEAHAVAAMGKIPDWPKIFGLYENVGPYTEQLRKLEKFVKENPSAAEGRFLLGFQYMMEGHKEAAKVQLTEALKLTPKDTLASKLLTQEGGTLPTSPTRLTERPTLPMPPKSPVK
jgi:hypothetical protein